MITNVQRLAATLVAMAMILAIATTPASANLPNCSNCIEASDIATSGVKAAEIAANAVGFSEIATDAVRSVEIATGAVGSSEILDGSIGLSELNFDMATQADLDPLFYCGQVATYPGSYASGPCGSLAQVHDGEDITGKDPSIAIGADGLPVISYHDDTNGDLQVGRCDNPSCTVGQGAYVVDSTGDVGDESSIAIGTDDLPVISYVDSTNSSLKVAHCETISCSSSTLTTVDPATDVSDTAIAIGADGLPIIAYYDFTNGDLRIAHCGNVACTAANSTASVDTTGDVGSHPDIAIGTDGLPVISYHNFTERDLMVTHCSNVACSSDVETQFVSAGDDGWDTSLAIGLDGLPIISHFEDGAADLLVTHCGTITCGSGDVTTNVDSTGMVGAYAAIAIGLDGLPVVSYAVLNDDPKVVYCGDVACSSGNTKAAVTARGDEAFDTSISIGMDGRPIVAYFDDLGGDLVVAHLGDH